MEKGKPEGSLPRAAKGGAGGRNDRMQVLDLSTKRRGEAAPANLQATAVPAAAAAKSRATGGAAPAAPNAAAATAPAGPKAAAAATHSTAAAAALPPAAAAPPGASDASGGESVATSSNHAGKAAATPASSTEAGSLSGAAGRTAQAAAAASPGPGAAGGGGTAATAASSPACRSARATVKTASGSPAALGGMPRGLPADEVLRGRHIGPRAPSAARATVRFSDKLVCSNGSSSSSSAAARGGGREVYPPAPAAAAEATAAAAVGRDQEAAGAAREEGAGERLTAAAAPGIQRPSGAAAAAAGGKGGGITAEEAAAALSEEEEGEGEAAGESAEAAYSAPSRQVSKGFTGETWYDFDLPLGRTDPITIIHFNDIYNIEGPPEGPGGVARFITAMQQYQHLHPFILFSGDVFNPSVMSTYTRGRHMVPFLNILKIHTACFGNHDFDFGVDELEYAVGSCNFPWLLSNVFQKTAADEELQRHVQQQQQLSQQQQQSRQQRQARQARQQRQPHLGGPPFSADAAAGVGEEGRETDEDEAGGAPGKRRSKRRGGAAGSSAAAKPTRSGSFSGFPRLSTLRTMDETACQALLSRPSFKHKGGFPSSFSAAAAEEEAAATASEDASSDTAEAAMRPDAASAAAAERGGRAAAGGSSSPRVQGHFPQDIDEDEEEESEEEENAEEAESSGRFVEDYIEIYGLPLANGMKYRLCEWQGIKVGLIGLVESEWLDTLGCVDREDVCYVDFVRAANCLSRVLRQKECELVIALTHMRAPNDEKLAREAQDIDLILGGHDHEYYGLQRIGNIPVVKSGTDFRDFTVLTIYPGSAAKKKEERGRCSSSSNPTYSGNNPASSNAACSNPSSSNRSSSSSEMCSMPKKFIHEAAGAAASPSLSMKGPGGVSAEFPSASRSALAAAFPARSASCASAAADPSSSSCEAAAASSGSAFSASAAAAAKKRGEAAGRQRQSAMLLSLPSASRRSRSSSGRNSSSNSNGSSRLTKSAGSTPVQSPRFFAAGGRSSSSSTRAAHARPPGLIEAKPRTTTEAPPTQFNGPLRPCDASGGEAEMPFFLGGSRVEWKRVHVDPAIFPKNVHVERLVRKYEEQLREQMQKFLVDVGCELDTRFSALRTSETNVGSWLCDVVRRECRAEVALLNSGTIRSDCIFPAGQLKFGDLAHMLPMADDMCVIEVSGEVLLQALENSVSLVPRTEGRFLQVAGLRFAFDSRRPPGQRVLRSSVKVASAAASAFPARLFTQPSASFSPRPRRSSRSSSSSSSRGVTAEDAGRPRGKDTEKTEDSQQPIGGRKEEKSEEEDEEEKGKAEETAEEEEEDGDCSFSKLDLKRKYSVATKTYVAQGRDGYHMLSGCRVLVEAELLPPLPTIVRSSLAMAELANGLKRPHSRIMFKRLTSFTSMQEDELLKDFGCRVNESSRYVLAPRADGRIRDIAAEQQQ